jgi:hypothetical protein
MLAIVFGVLMLGVAAFLDYAGRGDEGDSTRLSTDPNVGFRSPGVFWFSIGCNAAVGLAAIALGLWIL